MKVIDAVEFINEIEKKIDFWKLRPGNGPLVSAILADIQEAAERASVTIEVDNANDYSE